jgi:hypothetical protein
MTATTETGAPEEHAEAHRHPGPRDYVRIGVILAVLTALEDGEVRRTARRQGTGALERQRAITIQAARQFAYVVARLM